MLETLDRKRESVAGARPPPSCRVQPGGAVFVLRGRQSGLEAVLVVGVV
ncbi:hypothetical protein [Streptomyces sp. PSAA01]|nr:hypothetical protein [Streptomyces sp. PSAA01]MCG0285353.1 hypothetical protein [Streptomyces sp. PSAA01]